MNIIKTHIHDLLIIEPKVFGDKRGYFFESFRLDKFQEIIGAPLNFVQDNQSKSSKGVLRGLHYQISPKAQDKLVRVISGEIYDVAVDIRRTSPTFGKWHGEVLSAENFKQLWIPKGFAHGFVVLSEHAEIHYKTTDYYAPEFERSINFSDEFLNINWHYQGEFNLSDKDKNGLDWQEAEKWQY